MGVQVGFNIVVMAGHVGYSLRVCAEKPDGVWVELQAYSFPDPTIEFIEKTSLQLVAGWNALYDDSKA